MKARYDDDALSRVLGEHAIGTLVPTGSVDWIRMYFPKHNVWIVGICCLNQAAFNECDPRNAGQAAPRVSRWFDSQYEKGMTPEELLAGIEERK